MFLSPAEVENLSKDGVEGYHLTGIRVMGHFLSMQRTDPFQLHHFIFITLEPNCPAVLLNVRLTVVVAILYHTGKAAQTSSQPDLYRDRRCRWERAWSTRQYISPRCTYIQIRNHAQSVNKKCN